MNIVIIGAGTVGASLAQELCEKQHNVCLVDRDEGALRELEEQLDLQTVCGSGCEVPVLFQSGVMNADLCLAVTDVDAVNLVSASLAKALGGRRSVARVFDDAFMDHSTIDYQRHFRVDRLLSLESLTALELAKQIRMPGLFAVENFARGEVAVQEVVAEDDAQAVGVPLKELNLPRDVRIGLITTEAQSVIPGGDAHIRSGDRITLLGERNALENVKRMFEHKAPPRISVIIGGGGQVGYNLARHLQKRRCNVMIMETDERRCQYLSEKLDESVTVLHADVTRRSKMEEARVGKADVFVAATGHDEDNIVCGVEAKELGSRRILSIVRRPDYANVLEKLGIDLAVSPREVMEHQILGMLQSGPILTRSTVAGGDAEIWEVEVQASAPITRAALREFDLGHALIAAIDREEYVRVPVADDKLIAGDTVVVLVQNDNIKHVAQLFDVPRKHRL